MSWSAFRASLAPLAFGALLASIAAMWISPGGEADWLWELYDERNPVATGAATEVVRDGDAVLFRLQVDKHRACAFVQSAAYGRSSGGQLTQVNLWRVDKPMSGLTRPTGRLDGGVWRAHPVGGMVAIEYWITYRCSSRIVLARIADIPL